MPVPCRCHYDQTDVSRMSVRLFSLPALHLLAAAKLAPIALDRRVNRALASEGYRETLIRELDFGTLAAGSKLPAIGLRASREFAIRHKTPDGPRRSSCGSAQPTHIWIVRAGFA